MNLFHFGDLLHKHSAQQLQVFFLALFYFSSNFEANCNNIVTEYGLIAKHQKRENSCCKHIKNLHERNVKTIPIKISRVVLSVSNDEL